MRRWRVTNGTGATYYEAGAFIFNPGTQRFAADIPLKKGANTITYRLGNTKSQSLTTSFTTTVNEFTYSFAEGAVGTFFDTDITLANPAGVDAPLKIDFLPESGGTLTLNTTATAQSPLQVSVDSVVANGSPSTVVHSTDARAAGRRAHDDLGRHRLRRSRRHVDRAGDALAVRRRIARVLRYLRADGERQRDAHRCHGALPARERRRGERPLTIAAKSRHTMYAGDIVGAARPVVRHRHHVGAADHRGARDVSAGHGGCSRAGTNRLA